MISSPAPNALSVNALDRLRRTWPAVTPPSRLPSSSTADLGYRGKRLAKAGEALGITVKAIARGHDGVFIPTGIYWVEERSFSWISNYRRLNTIFERTKEHLVAFIEIAFVSILSRRIKRLVTEEVCA